MVLQAAPLAPLASPGQQGLIAAQVLKVGALPFTANVQLGM